MNTRVRHCRQSRALDSAIARSFYTPERRPLRSFVHMVSSARFSCRREFGDVNSAQHLETPKIRHSGLSWFHGSGSDDILSTDLVDLSRRCSVKFTKLKRVPAKGS
jgi:hypothetical protein